VKRGDAVSTGDVLAEVHARDEDSAAAAVGMVRAAYAIGDEPPRTHGIVLDVVP
jgi:thymidine phosphorylase